MGEGEKIDRKLLNSICDVPGIQVGHAQNNEARTGCTVILPENPVTAGVDVRGLAPGTREIELLDPVAKFFEKKPENLEAVKKLTVTR